MIEQIAAQPVWFWLCFGGLLLIAELLGTGGYLLWTGTAAVAVALITGIFPTMGWELQGVLFAILTLVSVIAWRSWLRHRPRQTSDKVLNQKTYQLIGLRTHLVTDTENGYARVKLADGSWRVHCDQELPANTEVEVIAVDGITLRVRPVRH
ncbi:NfeD family protein [Xenorhabdus nematophila]|uniref:Inner membrane protein ybbJ n=1 Tax=Xenorhabdus nematophila (strain ATCC 19061 / DSM 3370 / CCUG 14189 / LMG 1036 / NCIMB 9965 / AN6) TaxID=406817 RepID=D3VL44_XENNA|nr:NfeD family protein [Xenorhabdus nematophila]CEE92146.1 Inner membrane protein ybbJ [Xenorhabdus nematophila str. Anatoliense]CEF30592.1 Inner membrane protein ybbJ [Xenorhabdus nematophila str. Websteri]AYA41001.1 NfeD family protein [Xenorhabdus nematophila]KHD29408.1 membrane protein [Xenorhabdus nematophila]MBA0019748.1 NfeD family protein [Xenorhabdus nematophila]